MRAVAQDREIASLMGIDVDRVVVVTFVIGGMLAGIAGVLYALMFGQVGATMGFLPGIAAFTAAVLGGIGSIPGAAIGGFILGISESVGPTCSSSASVSRLRSSSEGSSRSPSWCWS